MFAVVQQANPTAFIVPVLLFLAVIAVCVTVAACLLWNVEPWTRKYLKPRHQLKADRYRLRIWQLRSKNPEAFAGDAPWQEQQLNVADILDRLERLERPTEGPTS